MPQTPPKTSTLSTTIQTASNPQDTKPLPPRKRNRKKPSQPRKDKPKTSIIATGAANQPFASPAMKGTKTGGVDWGGWEDSEYYETKEDYYWEEEDFYGGEGFDHYGQWEMGLDARIGGRECGTKDETTKSKRKGKAKDVVVDSGERDLATALKVLHLEKGSTGIDTSKSNAKSGEKPQGRTVAKPRLFELGCPYPPDALYIPFASGGRTSRRRGKGSYFVRGGLENLRRGRIVGSKKVNK